MRLMQVCLLLETSVLLLCVPSPSTASSANFSVVQFPSEVVAIIGENIVLNCAFHIQTGQAPSARGAMSWFKGLQGAESAVDKGHRYNISYPNTFRSSGEGSLIITNVSLEDTGRYTCKTMVWGLGEVRGNGINLQVYARPSHPIIFLQIQTEPKSSWTLVCRTHGFYPASVQVTWYLSRLKLPSSQHNWTDLTGFHQASSHLDLPYPHQKANYTCNVEHPSLIGPLSVQYLYEPRLQSCLTSSAIEILNLLKIGTIFSITIGFLTPVCVGFCKKHPGRSPIAHFRGPQHVLGSHTRGVF